MTNGANGKGFWINRIYKLYLEVYLSSNDKYHLGTNITIKHSIKSLEKK